VKNLHDFEPVPMRPAKRLTVVVLTHNRVKEVTHTVRHLLQNPDAPPIIVVDNGSSDGTCEVLQRSFSSIRVIGLSRNIGAAARNVGIIAADSPYVALCDDDTWWEPDGLIRAAEHLEQHPTLAIVCGRVLVGSDEREDDTCVLMSESPLSSSVSLPGKPILGFLAGASMIRRLAFIEVGGFEPRFFIGGEESLVAVDLAARGWELAYVNDVLVHHYPSPSRDKLSRQRLLFRNNLWFCWLRRPLSRICRETARAIAFCLQHPRFIPPFLEAFRDLRWIMRKRTVLPHRIEANLRLLERSASRLK
jgi:GT2 family glycosyltransferase